MKSLIVVDIQNDFCPGGALAVPEGDQVVDKTNQLIPYFNLILATQDWHPPGHDSFASVHNKQVGEIIDLYGVQQVLWPDHCVQNSWGSEFHPELKTNHFQKIFQKGIHQKIDSYSGFFENDRSTKTLLDSFLKENSVKEVYILGLATDYCVKYTVLDALNLGYKTFVIIDACRGVELNPGDVEHSIQEMSQTGANIINSKEILP